MTTKLYLILAFATIAVKSNAQNVGIGTATPKARLHVTDSNVVFSVADPLLAVPGNTPVSDAGARIMWHPGKAAFRAGFIDAVQWDKNNVGFYSFASGCNSTSNKLYSTALGRNTLASGTLALPGKIDEIKYKYLMQQNEYFDIITTGMSGDDNNVFVWQIFYKSVSTTPLLQKIITQVANVTNIMAGELSKRAE